MGLASVHRARINSVSGRCQNPYESDQERTDQAQCDEAGGLIVCAVAGANSVKARKCVQHGMTVRDAEDNDDKCDYKNDDAVPQNVHREFPFRAVRDLLDC